MDLSISSYEKDDVFVQQEEFKMQNVAPGHSSNKLIKGNVDLNSVLLALQEKNDELIILKKVIEFC